MGASSRTKPLFRRSEEPALRVCDFFEVAKNRCCKQNSYDDKIVKNSKKSQTLSEGEEISRPDRRHTGLHWTPNSPSNLATSGQPSRLPHMLIMKSQEPRGKYRRPS